MKNILEFIEQEEPRLLGLIDKQNYKATIDLIASQKYMKKFYQILMELKKRVKDGMKEGDMNKAIENGKAINYVMIDQIIRGAENEIKRTTKT